MKSIGEFFYLIYLRYKVALFHFLEEKKVRKNFYHNASFKKIDQLLKKKYRYKNPYSLCRRFNTGNIYGETPLSVFWEIFQKGQISKKDLFVDLGCGRGRGVFFASAFFVEKSIGIDCISYFLEKASEIASSLQKSSEFFCEDFLKTSLERGTFFYFYSICLEEKELLSMIARFEKLPDRTKIVTVSFPLKEYSPLFSTLASWESTFPWGKAEVFVNVLD